LESAGGLSDTRDDSKRQHRDDQAVFDCGGTRLISNELLQQVFHDRSSLMQKF